MRKPLSSDETSDGAGEAEGLASHRGQAVAGRSPRYRRTFAAQAAKLCLLGATDSDLADFFAVPASTIERWTVEHEEFSRVLTEAKEGPDARVERSLFQRAVGYTYDSEKVQLLRDGSVSRISLREHCPPDVRAQIFWLKNRRPEQWRDKHDHEHAGTDGTSLVPVLNVSVSRD